MWWGCVSWAGLLVLLVKMNIEGSFQWKLIEVYRAELYEQTLSDKCRVEYLSCVCICCLYPEWASSLQYWVWMCAVDFPMSNYIPDWGAYVLTLKQLTIGEVEEFLDSQDPVALDTAAFFGKSLSPAFYFLQTSCWAPLLKLALAAIDWRFVLRFSCPRDLTSQYFHFYL